MARDPDTSVTASVYGGRGVGVGVGRMAGAAAFCAGVPPPPCRGGKGVLFVQILECICEGGGGGGGGLCAGLRRGAMLGLAKERRDARGGTGGAR
jgi:hypothetical protein